MFDTVISSELIWGTCAETLYEEPSFCKACFQVGSKGEALVVPILLLNLSQKKVESRDGPERFVMTPFEYLYLNVAEIISTVLMRKNKLPSPYFYKLFYIGFCYLNQIRPTQ